MIHILIFLFNLIEDSKRSESQIFVSSGAVLAVRFLFVYLAFLVDDL